MPIHATNILEIRCVYAGGIAQLTRLLTRLYYKCRCRRPCSVDSASNKAIKTSPRGRSQEQPVEEILHCKISVKMGGHSLHRIAVSIALVFAIAVPSSMGHKHKPEVEKALKEICAKTNKSEECWKIIKSQFSRFNTTDRRGVLGVLIDLAISKANENHHRLNRLFEEASFDDRLKYEYISCSKNYNDAIRNLNLAKRSLDPSHHLNVIVEVADTVQELQSCIHEYDKETIDPKHFRSRNEEFGVYIDIVNVAAFLVLAEDNGSLKPNQHW
ncbi:UNVERIFIED_CONTAM: hypothetical protein Sradi_2159500 [Sesamum radiatum]|uniref:Pectinesterase inhibitor domain-containing protein n=1 Tax=Sesamum radiatum TaxID=300843 RepID=A0AAW2T125_SESRA